MEKKNSILVVLLSLIILGLCSFLVYDKVIKKEEKKEVISVKDAEKVKELYNNVSLTGSNYFAQNKFWLYYFRYDKILAEDMDDKVKIYLGLRKIKKDTSSSPIKYDANEVKKEIKSIFGSNVKYKDQSLYTSFNFPDKTPIPGWTEAGALFIKDKKIYEISFDSGSNTWISAEGLVVKATKTKNKIEIYEKHLISKITSIDLVEGKEYKKINYSKFDKSMEEYSPLTFLDEKDEIKCPKNNDCIEKGNTYKYTFNYDTKAKQYYFYSVEKVKE